MENKRLLEDKERSKYTDGSKYDPYWDIVELLKAQDAKSITERDKEWIETLKRLAHKVTKWDDDIHISYVIWHLIEQKGLDFAMRGNDAK